MLQHPAVHTPEHLRHTANISHWLQGIAAASPCLLPPHGAQKRPLAEVDDHSTTGLRKRTKTDSTMERDTVAAIDSQWEADPTPRAARNAPSDPTAAPLGDSRPPMFAISYASSSSATEDVQSSTSAASCRKRRRIESPTKQMAALRNADFSLGQRVIRRARDLPAALQPLISGFQRIQHAQGIVSPDDLSTSLLDRLDDVVSSTVLASPERAGLGRCPDLGSASDTVDYVTQRIISGASEPHWNSTVHSRLFDMAWRLSEHRSRTLWHNISTAAVHPAPLLPLLVDRMQHSHSKKADFCLSIRFDRDVERRLSKIGVMSLSQTDYPPLQWGPPAVSFETKRPGESWDEARPQLNTWALAQAKKLTELLYQAGRPNVQIPPLPLVIVQGETWTLLYLEVQKEQAMLWSKVAFADTSTECGFYQAIAGLQTLMAWADTDYRRWFEQNIARPLMERAEPG